MNDNRMLLAQFTELLNKHRTDSDECLKFLDDHKADAQLRKLADTVLMLRKALRRRNGQ